MEMNELIASFTDQLKEAMDIGRKATIQPSNKEINKVVVSGLGGSGIGGNLVSSVILSELQVPLIVNKGYHAPNYVDENTLVIISSYSGNTEETLNVFAEVCKSGARVIVISSGGKAIEEAKKRGCDHIEIPGGFPPRACLGYSFVQQLYILKSLELISGQFEKDLQNSIELLKENEKTVKDEARRLSEALKGKLPILYIEDRMEAVVVRWRQQINENSKMLCWHHVIPEMNHNELVGWTSKNEQLGVVFLRNSDDFKRNQQRIDLNKDVMRKFTSTVLEVYSKGTSVLEKCLYLVNIGDWLSVYLAEERKVDAVEVNVIDKLKSSLAGLDW